MSTNHKLANVTVEQHDEHVLVKKPGNIYKLPIVNEVTVAYHNIRRLPQWVKDALVLRTTYNNIYNGT